MSLERELELHVVEELLNPKEEPRDVEQPQVEEQRVVETTHAKPSTRYGRKCARHANIFSIDARDNVGAPTSQCRQRRSLEWYTVYMAFMREGIEIKPSFL